MLMIFYLHFAYTFCLFVMHRMEQSRAVERWNAAIAWQEALVLEDFIS